MDDKFLERDRYPAPVGRGSRAWVQGAMGWGLGGRLSTYTGNISVYHMDRSF